MIIIVRLKETEVAVGNQVSVDHNSFHVDIVDGFHIFSFATNQELEDFSSRDLHATLSNASSSKTNLKKYHSHNSSWRPISVGQHFPETDGKSNDSIHFKVTKRSL